MPLRATDPLWILLSAFTIASFGGIAAKLRSKSELTVREVIAALMYSGVCGLIVALAWYKAFNGDDNITFLLAISGLAGIGGANVLDMLKLFWDGKIRINIDTKPNDPDNPDKSKGSDE